MSQPETFVRMGPITDPATQIYIERPEDSEILRAVRRADYVTLLGARQTGKTSLLYMLKRSLKTEIPVFVDLAGFSGVKPDDWYDRVARIIVRRLPDALRAAVDKFNTCADPDDFRHVLWRIADASASTDRLVFLLDEIGSVPDEIRNDFFSTIRAIYNERGFDSASQKCIFVLAGATPLNELISSESDNSPFNISQPIYMRDFSRDDVGRFVQTLTRYGIAVDEALVDLIYQHTNGHPSLTQELFAHLSRDRPRLALWESLEWEVKHFRSLCLNSSGI